MTKQPLPAQGSTSWYPWATDVDTSASAVIDGRLADASLQLAYGLGVTAFNVKSYGAKGDGKAVTDAAITSGQATLTSATAAFTAADVGKVVLIRGAGAAGVPLSTTVSAYVNATTVTLAATAGTTVTGARAVYGTDDTAAIQATITACGTAGGGTVYAPAGTYMIAGPLQDTTGANAQITLPSIHAVNSEQITVVLRGARPAPPIVSVVGDTPLPDNHTVFQSTLVSGSGGAVIGAHGPSGSISGLTFIQFVAHDFTLRVPSNPVITGLDLYFVCGVDLDNVVVDTGSYYVQGLPQPTTASSYGIRLPETQNGAFTRLGAVNVIGFYTGYYFSEHTVGQQVAAWGCLRAAEFVGTAHGSHIQRFMAVHCQRGLVMPSSGNHYIDIAQYDIEHAQTGWWVTDYDIYDPSNRGAGSIRWHVVLANVGPDHTFTVSGAAGITAVEVGRNIEDRVWLPAVSMPVDAGTDALGLVMAVPVRLMEDGVSSQCRGTVLLPAHFVGDTVTVVALIANAGTGTGTVELGLVRQQFDPTSNLTSSWVASTPLTVTVGAQNVVQKVTMVSGVAVTSRHLALTMQRQGGDVNDVFTSTIGFLGLEVIRDFVV